MGRCQCRDAGMQRHQDLERLKKKREEQRNCFCSEGVNNFV